MDFDVRPSTKVHPNLTGGQPVWVKEPKTLPAVIVKPASPRSVLIKTQWNSTMKYLSSKTED